MTDALTESQYLDLLRIVDGHDPLEPYELHYAGYIEPLTGPAPGSSWKLTEAGRRQYVAYREHQSTLNAEDEWPCDLC